MSAETCSVENPYCAKRYASETSRAAREYSQDPSNDNLVQLVLATGFGNNPDGGGGFEMRQQRDSERIEQFFLHCSVCAQSVEVSLEPISPDAGQQG